MGAGARAANLQAAGQKEEGWRAKEEKEGELILTYIYEDDVSSESSALAPHPRCLVLALAQSASVRLAGSYCWECWGEEDRGGDGRVEFAFAKHGAWSMEHGANIWFPNLFTTVPVPLIVAR